MTTLMLSISNGSSLFLQTIRSTNSAWMSLSFDMIPSLNSELSALKRPKNQ